MNYIGIDLLFMAIWALLLIYALTSAKDGAFFLLVLWVIAWGLYAFFRPDTKIEPSYTYECPCKVDDLVSGEVNHYNKQTGDTTTTTYINIKDCVIVKD